MSISKKELYFITKSSKVDTDKKEIDIILSPEFYWIKNINLPNISLKEAKNMAPSIMEDFLPKGKYEYRVFKQDKNSYIIVAYDLKDIFSKLQSNGIKKDMISKIYLSQTEFDCKDNTIILDKNIAIFSQDGMIINIPNTLVNTKNQTININEFVSNHKTTNKYIYSKKFQNINLDKKTFFYINSLLILVLVYIWINIFYIQKNLNNLYEKKSFIASKYNLPSTNLQIKSIIKELGDINTHQTKLREIFYNLNNFKLNPKEIYKNFSINEQNIKFLIYLENKKRIKSFLKYISKYMTIHNKKFSNKILKVEIEL